MESLAFFVQCSSPAVAFFARKHRKNRCENKMQVQFWVSKVPTLEFQHMPATKIALPRAAADARAANNNNNHNHNHNHNNNNENNHKHKHNNNNENNHKHKHNHHHHGDDNNNYYNYNEYNHHHTHAHSLASASAVIVTTTFSIINSIISSISMYSHSRWSAAILMSMAYGELSNDGWQMVPSSWRALPNQLASQLLL